MTALILPAQLELEARCDAVLDQILAWPSIPWGDVAGGRPGTPTRREVERARETYGDPRFRPGRAWASPWTPEQSGAWSFGVDAR